MLPWMGDLLWAQRDCAQHKPALSSARRGITTQTQRDKGRSSGDETLKSEMVPKTL